jgi:hypothetical protein
MSKNTLLVPCGQVREIEAHDVEERESSAAKPILNPSNLPTS